MSADREYLRAADIVRLTGVSIRTSALDRQAATGLGEGWWGETCGEERA